METTPSILQAIASLLVVIGLIMLCAWAVRRFAFGGNLLKMAGVAGKTQKILTVVETLWLDARHRVVVVQDGAKQHTLLLGPNNALQLSEKPAELRHG
jgi:flagellar protein FliO/FliZ